MKMVMISCNEAIDDEVSEVLTECGLENYTKFPVSSEEEKPVELTWEPMSGREEIIFI